MSNANIQSATTTSLKTGVPDFSVASKTIDEAHNESEYYWYFSDFPQNLGYYKTIPELKKAVDAFAMWTCGKGYSCKDLNTEMILEHFTGFGKDNFSSIMQNMVIMKKVNGDSFAEIMRGEDENETPINLKPLNPHNVRIVTNGKGLLVRYDIWDGKEWKEMKKEKIFHLTNDRIASECHGVSVIEACKWVIDARNEAMSDKRRVLHRSTIRVMYVDSDDTEKYSTLKEQYKEAIKNGEVLILPKDSSEMKDFPAIDTAQHSEWIQYLEQFYYKAVGVPEIIMGGSQNYSEASSKVGHMTFEQPHESERDQLEREIWNQLQLEVDFDEPTSLRDAMQQSEAANTGQLNMQPNDLSVGMTRTE